ncbi:MAG: hypothetical protein ACYS26_00355 [Planctomycetota bacterium]|jgi:hypothetical protein
MQLRSSSARIAARTLPLLALAALGSCQIIAIDSDHEFVGISLEGPLGELTAVGSESVEVRVGTLHVRSPNKQSHTHFKVTAFQDQNGDLNVDADEPSSVVKSFQAEWSAFEVGEFSFRLPEDLFGERLAIRVDLWDAYGEPLASYAALIGPTHTGVY